MDELYVIARRVLLDAVEALGDHRHATVLVGAQAVYLHTTDADLGPFLARTAWRRMSTTSAGSQACPSPVQSAASWSMSA